MLSANRQPLTADLPFLAHATRLAERGLGRTWPNPSVGCVIVKEGHIIGAARTADSGRPHAETRALAMAGAHARGATAYTTLEPCAHHGKTPPCAQALIDAGIARVVYACDDPDPRVRGAGVNMLLTAKILVEKFTDHQIIGSSDHLNHGFFRRIQHGIPHVAMKLATSLDGRMTDAYGASKWITGEAARQHAHSLRARYDAILTGIGTVLADDPLLTARPPAAANPYLVRIVADRQLRLPLHSKLTQSAGTQPVWVITSADAVEQAASHATDLREAGVVLLVVEDGALSPTTILKTLGNQGITRLLIEAGPTLSTAFIAANEVETLHWYRAPIMLGNTGKAALDALHTPLADAHTHTPTEVQALGNDRYEYYEL